MREVGSDRYGRMLERHHEVVRAGLLEHGGVEQGTQGDSFFAVFTSPSASVAAALQIQQQLSAFDWPDGVALRVRIGVHSGEASTAATGLVGYEVHRAARIAAVGYGGQVLLSSAAAGLVEDTLEPGVTLRDLGSHRLKDLGHPETIFQLVADGIELNFPPLRSLDNPELANNLPTSLSPFIGREEEVAEVLDLVATSRLVTLTGSGGSGKTRLALQVAAELLDGTGEGVWFVDLATISNPDEVASCVLTSLGLRPQPESSALESLLNTLKTQNALLTLDNCEHVIGAVAKLVDVLGRGCPRISIMTTSREPLGTDGEKVYRVRSLSLPSEIIEGVSDLEGSDAVNLFLARTNSRDSTFVLDDDAAPMVASICRRLDGIPLAIELAASRLSSMSLEDLLDRLDQRFRLLTGGSRNALPRQQTLGAMVAWSYDLLNEPERDVLRRLSVFVGGFDLKAAEYVCSTDELESFDVADIVSSLVNKSLVSGERTSTAFRYRLLETIRQYAADQLIQIGGERVTSEVRRRHADYFRELCEGAAPFLRGPDQGVWMKRFDVEWDNIQSAWRHFLDDPDDYVAVMSLGVSLSPFLGSRLKVAPIEWLKIALEGTPQGPTLFRGQALLALGDLRGMTSNGKEELGAALSYLEEARRIAVELGERPLEARAMAMTALATRTLGDVEKGQQLGRDAFELAQASGDPHAIGHATLVRALTEMDSSTAHDYFLQALDYFRRVGDLLGVCTALIGLSITGGLFAGDAREAKALTDEALAIAEEIGSPFHTQILWTNHGITLFLLGELEESERFSRRALFAARRLGLSPWALYWIVFGLGCTATARGDLERGAILLGAHDAMEESLTGTIGYWSPMEIAARENNRSTLIDTLGVGELERLVAVGRGLSLDRLVEYALGRVGVAR